MSAEATPTTAPPWRKNLVLFVATVLSVFATYVVMHARSTGYFAREGLVHGAQFAGTLLTILVAHELGHYIAARIHKVDASLPYFIPLPLLSPFGTMGAVIRMRGTIPTRRALLDIGAAGPLAGLVFAIPLYLYGIAHSKVIVVDGDGVQLGESILLKTLDWIAAPKTTPGTDILLSPVAFGAWGGFFVTMINLLPVGQLDGGHVAYALFGPKQDRYAKLVHRAMLVLFFVVLGGHCARDIAAGVSLRLMGRHLGNATVWLVWFQLLAILGILAARSRGDEQQPGSLTVGTRILATLGLVGVASLAREKEGFLVPIAFFAGLAILLAMEVKGGSLRPNTLLDHPSTGAEPLDGKRKAIAIFTLVMFVLLFMPEPISM
jgi:membrane-associated protease RseP (regulator of RpoE activity)